MLDTGEQEPIMGALLIIRDSGVLLGVFGCSCSSSSGSSL